MENLKNKKISKLTATVISAIAALILSGIATIIAVLSIDKSLAVKIIAPIFIGLTTASLTLSIALLVIGGIYESKSSSFCGAVLLFLAVVFGVVTGCLFGMFWWIGLIIAVIAIPVLVMALLLIYRKHLVLVADNEVPQYEDWKTRQAKKEAEKGEEEQEALPEIKSFK